MRITRTSLARVIVQRHNPFVPSHSRKDEESIARRREREREGERERERKRKGDDKPDGTYHPTQATHRLSSTICPRNTSPPIIITVPNPSTPARPTA
jgi:hypothetical protein